MMQMICPKCGKTYNNKVTYCISCGAELVPEEKTVAEETAAAETPSAEGIFDGITSESETPRNNIMMSSSASVEEPAEPPETKAEIPVKEKRSASEIGKAVLKRTVSACLSVLLAAAALLGFGTAAARELTDKSVVAEAVRSADLLSVPAKELGITENSGFDIPEEATVEEAVAVMAAGSGVDSGNIRRIYESSTLKEFISGAAAEYAEYLRSGSQPNKLTAERIKAVFLENLSVISSNTGVNLSESDIELACREIERTGEILSSISVSSIENGASGKYIRIARAYMSVPVLIAEAAAAAVIIALLAIVNKNASAALKYTGVPVFIAGAAALAATFMFTMQIGPFSGLTGLTLETVKGLSAAASGSLYRMGGTMLFIGAAAMSVSAAMKKSL